MDQQIEEVTGIKSDPLKTPETTPAAEVNAQPAVTEQTQKTTPEEPKVNEADTEEKEFWEKEDLGAKPVEEDWKSKFEGTHSEYMALKNKIESNKVTKALLEVMDSPNFDFSAFLETQTAKKLDFTKVPIDALYKASLESDTVANYTPEEIEALWEEKQAELKDSPLKEKQLKSELVKQFQSQQPQESTDEPELIKLWKTQKEEQKAEATKRATEHKQVMDGISTYTEGLVGQKMGGVEITKEDIEAVKEMTSIDYYKNNEGKIDEKRIAIDRLKARMWDKSQKFYKSDAVREAKKAITRPSTSSGGGEVGNTDPRTEEERILDQAAQEMGLKDRTAFTGKN